MVKSNSNANQEIYEVLIEYDDGNLDLDDTVSKLLDVFDEKEFGENKIDRVKDWDEFSNYMRKYIEDKTVSKYGKRSSTDLMAMTNPDVCIWNIIKYAMRLYNGAGKRYDLEKIIHYAQMAITLSEGDLTKCGVRENENPNRKFWLE